MMRPQFPIRKTLPMSQFDRVEFDASDAELIAWVRSGDLEAYGVLFARHRDAALRLARSLMPGSDADDLVSDGFAKVLGVLQKGGGPDLAFRAYLLTAIRRLHIDRIRAVRRTTPTDDLEALDKGEPFSDPAVAGFENAAAARAFASLPERWQLVLWHLEVEGQKPAEVAPLLGMSANSVSALAYRAREGLRQAFLQMHAADVLDDRCTATRQLLGGYVRQGLSRRDNHKVSEHLQTCRPCTALYLELTEVNSSLAAILGPVVLGSAAAAYLAAAGTAASSGGVLAGVGVLLGRARDLVVANSQAAIAIGAAAAVAGVAATGVLIVNAHSNKPATPIAAPSISEHASPGHRAARPGRPAATPSGTATVVVPTPGPSVGPTAMPTPPTTAGQPAASPTDAPSDVPSNTSPATPTGTPTGTATQQPSKTVPPTALALSASVLRTTTSPLGTSLEVGVRVRGLKPGNTTTLTLRLPPGATFISLPSGCSSTGLVSVCRVDGDQPTLFTTIRTLHLLGLQLQLEPLLGSAVGDLALTLLP